MTEGRKKLAEDILAMTDEQFIRLMEAVAQDGTGVFDKATRDLASFVAVKERCA